MRGDPPIEWTEGEEEEKSTPHARGSTQVPGTQRVSKSLACAGIHRSKAIRPIAPICPLACAIHLIKRALEYSLASLPAWGSPCSLFLVGSGTSTPHARGSTSTAVSVWTTLAVYPACAGIHRSMENAGRLKNSLPRMRGDPPGEKVGLRGY